MSRGLFRINSTLEQDSVLWTCLSCFFADVSILPPHSCLPSLHLLLLPVSPHASPLCLIVPTPLLLYLIPSASYTIGFFKRVHLYPTSMVLPVYSGFCGLLLCGIDDTGSEDLYEQQEERLYGKSITDLTAKNPRNVLTNLLLTYSPGSAQLHHSRPGCQPLLEVESVESSLWVPLCCLPQWWIQAFYSYSYLLSSTKLEEVVAGLWLCNSTCVSHDFPENQGSPLGERQWRCFVFHTLPGGISLLLQGVVKGSAHPSGSTWSGFTHFFHVGLRNVAQWRCSDSAQWEDNSLRHPQPKKVLTLRCHIPAPYHTNL